MTSNTTRFRVDPRLAAILGENYRTSEQAIKELVDNAWDAEATEVQVTLPAVLTEDPVVVKDNGSGMKKAELESEYLNIASPRWTRKGELTPNKKRVVKGRRGIGKFAGLILASEMEVQTSAFGVRTTLRIEKGALLRAGKDLEKVPLPLDSQECDKTDHGTTITLRSLNTTLNFPKPDKLKEILAYDYGRETDFIIFVNGERVFHHDIHGERFEQEVELPNGQKASVKWTVAEKPLPGKKAGVILRVGGKSVGRAHCFGLEHDETLSDRLRRRLVGEINIPEGAIGLTAAGGEVIESDKGFEHLSNVVQDSLKDSLAKTHTNEFNLAQARWTQKMKRRLEAVPEHRREIVEERLTRLISRSYQEGEKEERIDVLIDLVLDALEMDEYWTVCRHIEDAEKADVFHFAEALDEFGLCDIAFMGVQAKRRLEFLDHLDRLVADPKTTEKELHQALQSNFWAFGHEYSLMSSNRTLQGIIADYTQKKYTEKDGADRPDLLLASDFMQRHLLVEFKRPSITVGREAETQAKKYADTLTGRVGIKLDILVIGGEVDPKLQHEYDGKTTRFLSYRAVIAAARAQLEWLLKQIQTKPGKDASA
ncbi:MAG TPA: ATP-binding protein [Clostridia bacterium]|nr:ATP-binding protein [Clostridia bacterium]